eukprot:10062500-Lingulodinium_polyedra.AAC.1
MKRRMTIDATMKARVNVNIATTVGVNNNINARRGFSLESHVAIGVKMTVIMCMNIDTEIEMTKSALVA